MTCPVPRLVTYSGFITIDDVFLMPTYLLPHSVAGDESVTAEFTIEPGMFRSLQGEIDAAVGASGEAVWGETTASEGLESLASALEDSRLDALNVVGWEINERHDLTGRYGYVLDVC